MHTHMTKYVYIHTCTCIYVLASNEQRSHEFLKHNQEVYEITWREKRVGEKDVITL